MAEMRKLAAVLAADIVGFSRLTGADEERTLARVRALRSDLIDPTIAIHKGRVVKWTGDGTIVEFRSVVEAVRCGLEVQNSMAERNAGLPLERRIELRIGIHLGDVVEESDGDLMGDGVNIAARLEGIAQPGSICLSEDAYRQVKSRVDLAISDLGETRLKNIADPVRIYSLQVGAANAAKMSPVQVAAAAPAPAVSLPEKPSIAVLPFQNMSGDPEQEYFAEGVIEDIIMSLSRIRAFFVISSGTSFAYKGQAADPLKVAQELGVGYIVEGSIRRAGSRIRITAKLIEGQTGHHLWAERYDREMTDVFAVQDEIAQSIIGAIAPGIISAEIRHAQHKDVKELNAWDRVMRANWHIRRFTQIDLAEAQRLLAEAIDRDPASSIAFSDLALLHHFQAVFGWSDRPDAHAAAGEAARKALQLDGSDATAHTVLAIHEMFSNRHEEARRRLRRATDLDPNSAFAHGYTGVSHCFAGECDAALAKLDHAIRLSPRDPLLVIWQVCKGWAAFTAERYEDAIGLAIQAADANADFPDVWAVRAAAEGHLGRLEAGQATLNELQRRLPALKPSDQRLRRPFVRANDQEHFFAGLRKAGLCSGLEAVAHDDFRPKFVG